MKKYVELQKQQSANARLDESSVRQVGTEERNDSVEDPVLQPARTLLLVVKGRCRLEYRVKQERRPSDYGGGRRIQEPILQKRDHKS